MIAVLQSASVHDVYQAVREGKQVIAVAGGEPLAAERLALEVREVGLDARVDKPPPTKAIAHVPRLGPEPVVVVPGDALDALVWADAFDAECTICTKRPRYHHLSYETAARFVEPRAVQFAESRKLKFRVGGALVGEGPDWHEPPAKPRLRVALLGFGTVGRGVWQRLRELEGAFEVVSIGVRDRAKAIAAGAPEELVGVAAQADVLVELIGAGALPCVEEALSRGVHVVTANKALVAEHGVRLEKLAAERGARLLYSASVGGALPALETVRREAVRGFSGVLNATSNYVLDAVARGLSLEAAVREAQDAGYAEADPTLDLDGTDAAQKLRILARAAFGTEPRVRTTGIAQLDAAEVRAARSRGEALRLVAWTDGVDAFVKPVALPLQHPLGATKGAENRLLVERSSGAPLLLAAQGAGRLPTAEAVLADLFDVVRA